MASRLGIHILGPRYGESIILHLPNGEVGVIDSFAPSHGRHPIVAFLTRRFPDLSYLRFLAVTHPHADHCFRIADILDHYPPQEVWAFHPFPAGEIQRYYTALYRCGARDRVEEELELPAGSVAQSLLQFRQRIQNPILDGTLRFRRLAGGDEHPTATFCGNRVRISYLTPDVQAQTCYALEVEEAAERIFADGPTLRAAHDLRQPEHNAASGAVLVEFGATRVLLMADAEEPLWRSWLGTAPPPERLLQPVHFLKVSHHGSRNGYHQPLFDTVCRPELTMAVITPFNHGKVHLPSKAGVDVIRPHVRELYCTNRTLAANSTGLSWDAANASALPPLPKHWDEAVTADATLARLFVPTVGLSSTPGDIPLLPSEWFADAHANPLLWSLLIPVRRVPMPSPEAVEDHVISAYFDESGNRVMFNAGSGTGRLAPA